MLTRVKRENSGKTTSTTHQYSYLNMQIYPFRLSIFLSKYANVPSQLQETSRKKYAFNPLKTCLHKTETNAKANFDVFHAYFHIAFAFTLVSV